MDGLLLGDGYISNNGTLRLNQASKKKVPSIGVVYQKPWLTQVTRQLRKVGCKTTMLKIAGGEKFIVGRMCKFNISYQLYSPAYEDFKIERIRWYPKGLKIVPNDLVLTPLILSHWFAGDGCGRKYCLSFCTNGFKLKDVKTLSTLMRVQLGINMKINKTRMPNQYELSTASSIDVEKLYMMLNPILAVCFRYKLRFAKGRHVRK